MDNTDLHIKLLPEVCLGPMTNSMIRISVDFVIFACLILLRIYDFGTRFRDLSMMIGCAIITIIFVRFLNSRICRPRDIREN